MTTGTAGAPGRVVIVGAWAPDLSDGSEVAYDGLVCDEFCAARNLLAVGTPPRRIRGRQQATAARTPWRDALSNPPSVPEGAPPPVRKVSAPTGSRNKNRRYT
ncbi:hypothetical protein [Streptomyces acidiscabies]|uniref:hypothetical protein n=1 Tax=Streptomyces acidiscabies TaxID=42234 RepID=UPI00095155CA|nr:hypothetical protein [Streptomyces acidiscabies]